MKRYIHASFNKVEPKEVCAEADKILAQHNSKIDWDTALINISIRGQLVEFNGEHIGKNITIGGYSAPVPYFFFDQYRSDKDVKEQIMDYLDSVQNTIDGLRVVVSRIPTATQLVKDIVGQIHQYYVNDYSDVSVSADIDTEPDWTDFDFIVRDANGGNECPRFKFDIVVNGVSFTETVRWEELERGEVLNNLISAVNKKIKRANRTESGNKLLVQILKEHGIDTTKSEYELKAVTYERYGSGKTYVNKFACPGDYLAYFSMAIHKQPSVRNIDKWYGMDDFEDIVERYPTIEDISDYASSNWWGDGDDYIIYLKNLTTGEILYKGNDTEDDNGGEG